MNIQTLFNHLNEDLQREYAHWHFYMNAASGVQGLHREEIHEFLLGEMNGEQKHVEEFRRMLQGVKTRRKITTPIQHTALENSYRKNLTNPKEILEAALAMEDEVVENYTLRIQECNELQESVDIQDKIDGKYIELFLEDQILDSRGDADHIREMIVSLP